MALVKAVLPIRAARADDPIEMSVMRAPQGCDEQPRCLLARFPRVRWTQKRKSNPDSYRPGGRWKL